MQTEQRTQQPLLLQLRRQTLLTLLHQRPVHLTPQQQALLLLLLLAVMRQLLLLLLLAMVPYVRSRR
jgi:hypothetical protein